MATLQEVHLIYLETGREYYRTNSSFGLSPGHMVADDTIHEAAVFTWQDTVKGKRSTHHMPLTPYDILAEDWINEPDPDLIPVKRASQIKIRGAYVVIDAKKVGKENKCFLHGFFHHDGKTEVPNQYLYVGPLDLKKLSTL
jgi:hypothetical protein